MRTSRASRLVLGLLAAPALLIGGAGPGRTSAQDVLAAAGVKGGLVVHAGCGDGKLTAALRANESYLVHGLDADPANVERARAHVRSLGLSGPVSIDRFDGRSLPFIDNLANLVVADDPGKAPMDEILRVLAPGGTALVGGKKTVKPRPGEIDEWTHYLHDASNNAVAHDATVGPPRRLQWVGSPRWARHHDHMASMSAAVTTGGRLFYIMDEGSKASIQLPPRWSLAARDAFNGTLLWRRPIEAWFEHRWPLKSGHGQLPRRLVAQGDTVYATMGIDAPVSALDAATGRTVRTYEETKGAEEILLSDGVLFLLVGYPPTKDKPYVPAQAYCWTETSRANRDWAWDEKPRRVAAVQADSGKTLWSVETAVAPLTLAADRDGVFLHDGEKVVRLDRRTGKTAWSSPPLLRRSPVPASYGPTLVLHEDVVLFAGGGRDRKMHGLSAADGKVLWSAPHPRGGHQSPEDLLVAGGLVWSGAVANGQDSGVFTGRDPRTGQVKAEFPPDVKTYWFHHRCHRSKATDKYFLSSRTGIEFIDLEKKHWEAHHWVRGGCVYGVLPANGLLYAPPHSCGCYLESKLCGFNALAPAGGPPVPKDVPEEGRLERGPAYEDAAAGPAAGPADWPTYRHDAARSGATKAAVPPTLKQAWQADLGGRLTSPVAAGNAVYVASIDAHAVHALDAATGAPLWSFVAGGRVDSPPTIHEGRVLFGSADGFVYCLRASDGALAWRFRAAPLDRRLVAYEQVESVWPVHGSVLLLDGALHCTAGRSMFLDGGIRLLKLDPKTGRRLAETVLDDRDPASGQNLQVLVKNLTMPVALPDVLSSDGKHLYMRSQRFGLDGARQDLAPREVTEQAGEGAHLFSSIGFLDDAWFHRGYWQYGRTVISGWGAWPRAAHQAPAGKILCVDGDAVYGFGQRPEFFCQTSVLEYHLFAAGRDVTDEAGQRVKKALDRINAASKNKNAAVADWSVRKTFPAKELTAAEYRWTGSPPFLARGLVLAGGTLYAAGPPDLLDEEQVYDKPVDAAARAALDATAAAWAGRKGALLWPVPAADGRKLSELRLDSVPVFDGLIAANGKLFAATTGGKILCLGGGP